MLPLQGDPKAPLLLRGPQLRSIHVLALLSLIAVASFLHGVAWGEGSLTRQAGQGAGQQDSSEDASPLPQQLLAPAAATLEGGDAGRAAPCASKGAEGEPRLAGRIPRILHHIFIPEPGDNRSAELGMLPHHKRWVDNCRLQHSKAAGWEYRLWNASACEELVAQHYPSSLDFYHNLTMANEKTDLMRYLVMHKYGGLYLDSDVECWREGSDMLEGCDVVLQGTHTAEGAGSASMASVPGASVWLATLELVVNRNVTTDSWVKSIQRTGPDLLTDAMVHIGVNRRSDKLFNERNHHDGLVYCVHAAGSWYLPCQWWEQQCRREVYQKLVMGQMDLTRTVGMHRFAGSWIYFKKEGKGIENATAELCGTKQ